MITSQRVFGIKALLHLFLALILLGGAFSSYALAQQTAMAQQLNSRGEEAMKAGRSDEARRCFEQSILADFLFPEPRYNLSRLAFEKGDLKGAMDQIKKAISLKPYEKRYRTYQQDLYVRMAREFLSMDRMDLAVDSLEKATKIDENHMPTQLFRHEILFGKGDYSAAADLLNGILARDDNRTCELDRQTRCRVLALLAETLEAQGKDLEAYRRHIMALRAGAAKFPQAMEILNRAAGSDGSLLNLLVSGDKSWAAGDLDRAEEHYRRALKINPELPSVKTRLSNLESRRKAIALVPQIDSMISGGELERAQSQIETLQTLDPEGEDAAMLLERLAAAQEKLSQAQALERKAEVERQRQEATLAYELDQVRTFISRKDFSSAQAALKDLLVRESDNRQALELQRTITQALEQKARLASRMEALDELVRKGEFARAAEQYRTFLAQAEEASLHLGLAQCAASLGDREQASLHFRRFIEMEPEDPRGILGLAKIERAQAGLDAALEMLKASSNASRSEVKSLITELENEQKTVQRRASMIRGGWILMGILLLLALRALIRWIPGWRHAKLLESARASAVAKKWNRALEQFSAYLSHESVTPSEAGRIKLEMARCLLEAGRAREALAQLKELLARDQKNMKLRTLLAHAFIACGEISEEAMDEYRNLIKYEAGNLNLIRLMGQYYLKSGETGREARELFDMILVREPDNRDVLIGYARALAAESASDSRSISIYTRALELNTELFEVRQSLAKALQKAGQLERAAEEALISLEADPENMAMFKIYSEAMMETGQFDQAIQVCSRLLQEDPDNGQLQAVLRKIEKAKEKAGS